MSQAARVDQIDSVRDFRTALCRFGEEVKEALCGAEMEIRRTLDWLEERLTHWRAEIRRREREVAQAKIELAQRKLMRIGGRSPDCIEQEKALRRARRRLEEAEDKVNKVRHWTPIVEHTVTEYQGPSRQLAVLIEHDLPLALAILDRKSEALEDYLRITVPAMRATAPEGGSA